MKKNNFIIAFMTIMLIFISCEREDPTNEDSILKTPHVEVYESSTEDGSFHNIGLKLYVEEIKNKNISNRATESGVNFKEVISDISNVLKSKRNDFFIENDLAFTLNRIDKVIGDKNLDRKNFINFTHDAINLFSTGKEKALYLNILQSNSSYNEVLIKTNKLLKSNELTIKETKNINTFIEVYKASYDYWTKTNTAFRDEEEEQCDPQSQVYFSDAVGAVIFGGIGGIGMSWAIYELQEGYCL